MTLSEKHPKMAPNRHCYLLESEPQQHYISDTSGLLGSFCWVVFFLWAIGQAEEKGT